MNEAVRGTPLFAERRGVGMTGLVVERRLAERAANARFARIPDYDRTYRRFSAFRKELQRAAKNTV